MNAAPATRLIQSSGRYWLSTLPTITPIAETATRANEAPMKTSQGRFFSAAMVIAAIGPEARTDARGFARAVKAALQRLSAIQEVE